MSDEKKKEGFTYETLIREAADIVAMRQNKDALKPVTDTLVTIRAAKNIYVSLGWLTQPLIDTGNGAVPMMRFIGDLKYTELLENLLETWFCQFSRAIPGDDSWAANLDALHVIRESLRNGREYVVYVPMFKATFRSAGSLNDDTAVVDIDSAGLAFADFTAVYRCFYQKHLKAVNGGKCANECDREYTEDERKAAVKKLERIRRKMDEEQHFKLTTTRKLRMQLRYLVKERPSKMVLDVCGWVVHLEEPMKGTFTLHLPWLKRELDNDEFHEYVTAQTRKCPVAWEYLYMIDETLQSL